MKTKTIPPKDKKERKDSVQAYADEPTLSIVDDVVIERLKSVQPLVF